MSVIIFALHGVVVRTSLETYEFCVFIIKR